jgi:hypothetical protein
MSEKTELKKIKRIKAVKREQAFVDKFCTIIKLLPSPAIVDTKDKLQVAQSLFDIYAVIQAQKRFYAAMDSKKIKRKINAFTKLMFIAEQQKKILKTKKLESVGLKKILQGEKASLEEITTLLRS